MKDVILTCFAGRQEYMELQLKYMLRILDEYEFVKHYDIWNFSWSENDREWVDRLSSAHEKIRVRHAPDYGKAVRAGEVASKQFAYFFSEAYDPKSHQDTVFIKIDDDVVYVDHHLFKEFIAIRQQHPEVFLMSADVVNSDLFDRHPERLHERFLSEFDADPIPQPLIRELYSNKRRLSVNFVSWMGADLDEIITEFSNGIGSEDEWRMCHVIPTRLGRQNMVIQNFTAVHLAFGGQLKSGQFDSLKFLQRYNDVWDLASKFKQPKRELPSISDGVVGPFRARFKWKFWKR